MSQCCRVIRGSSAKLSAPSATTIRVNTAARVSQLLVSNYLWIVPFNAVHFSEYFSRR